MPFDAEMHRALMFIAFNNLNVISTFAYHIYIGTSLHKLDKHHPSRTPSNTPRASNTTNQAININIRK